MDGCTRRVFQRSTCSAHSAAASKAKPTATAASADARTSAASAGSHSSEFFETPAAAIHHLSAQHASLLPPMPVTRSSSQTAEVQHAVLSATLHQAAVQHLTDDVDSLSSAVALLQNSLPTLQRQRSEILSDIQIGRHGLILFRFLQELLSARNINSATAQFRIAQNIAQRFEAVAIASKNSSDDESPSTDIDSEGSAVVSDDDASDEVISADGFSEKDTSDDVSSDDDSDDM